MYFSSYKYCIEYIGIPLGQKKKLIYRGFQVIETRLYYNSDKV